MILCRVDLEKSHSIKFAGFVDCYSCVLVFWCWMFNRVFIGRWVGEKSAQPCSAAAQLARCGCALRPCCWYQNELILHPSAFWPILSLTNGFWPILNRSRCCPAGQALSLTNVSWSILNRARILSRGPSTHFCEFLKYRELLSDSDQVLVSTW